MRLYIFIFIFFICGQLAHSQAIPRFNPDTILTMKMDEDAVVKVGKAGLDIEDFIHEIVTDSSFYEAFRKMKKYTFNAENNIYTYDKNDKVQGSIYRKLMHFSKGIHLKILEEKKQAIYINVMVIMN